jgi:hypothetical protein
MNLTKRLEQLEARRPEFGLPVAQMSDSALIAYLTNGKSATISDAELERIIEGEALDNQGSHGDKAG